MGRRQARRAAALLAIGLAVAGLSACGDDDSDKNATTERSAPSPSLSPKELAKLPAGSPQRAVLELWYDGQLGSAPEIVDHYSSEARKAVGATDIAGAYSLQRGYLLSAAPEVADVSRGREGTRVILRVQSSTGPSDRESFIVRRQSGEWRVVFDTFLERALPIYVQSEIATPGEAPSARAVAAGRSAAARYRAVALGDE